MISILSYLAIVVAAIAVAVVETSVVAIAVRRGTAVRGEPVITIAFLLCFLLHQQLFYVIPTRDSVGL